MDSEDMEIGDSSLENKTQSTSTFFNKNNNSKVPEKKKGSYELPWLDNYLIYMVSI